MRSTRSPLKQMPLNTPGESLGRQIDDLIFEKGLFWFLAIAFSFVITGLEWYRYLLHVPPSPWFMTACAVGVTVLAVFKLKALPELVRQTKQGLDGEKTVGYFLEGLKSQGYQVIHDVCENGYNIDHVLIGPAGVFAIETKTISKPTDHDAMVLYDGQRVLVDGYAPDRDPLKQAQASADRIQDILQGVIGKPVPVRPVVVYPGWFIDKKCRSPKIWVVNENLLPAYLDHEDECLTEESVRGYTTILANHIRSLANRG